MATIQDFIASFASQDNHTTVRQEALGRLSEMAFPNRKTEAWKYTRVAQLTKSSFQNNSGLTPSGNNYDIPGLDCHKLVFVNGKLEANLSDFNQPEEIKIANLGGQEVELEGALDVNNNVFTTINQALFTDGLFLTVGKNIALEKPIHVVHLSLGENSGNQLRHILKLEEGASAEVIFSYLSEDQHNQFNNMVLEAHVGANADLKVIKLQNENEASYHIGKDNIQQDKDSLFSINTLCLGGKMIRNDLEISVNGSNCETVLNGAYVCNENQHVDNHTVVDHKVPDCYSNELYKGILADKSTGVFNGKVFVRQDAQRINAFQSNGNILLSDDASVNTKPELEIYADDVKCSHGTTTGQLDKEAVFYLRARGLSEQSAKKLLVRAFAGETIENISNEVLRDWASNLLDSKFETL